MTKRLLLASWGRGNGHITRLLQIGKAFQRANWDVVVLTHNDAIHVDKIRSADMRAVTYPQWADDADPWASWHLPDFLRRSVEWDLDILGKLQPDRVIHDSRISLTVACPMAGVPLVSVCQDNQLPGFMYGNQPIAPIWTQPVRAVNAFLREQSLPEIDRDIRELYLRGRIAIPSSPDFDPIDGYEAGADVVHTGVLSALPPSRGEARNLLFYRVVGLDLDDFVDAFATWSGTIYIATGSAEFARKLSPLLSGQPLQIAPLWELENIAPTLRATVHHGGHGITMTCAASGIPSVVLPGHNPERQLNGLRAEKVGLARILLPESDSPFEWGPSVDQTSHRPPWALVRAAIDELPSRRSHMPNQLTDVGDLVNLLT